VFQQLFKNAKASGQLDLTVIGNCLSVKDNWRFYISNKFLLHFLRPLSSMPADSASVVPLRKDGGETAQMWNREMVVRWSVQQSARLPKTSMRGAWVRFLIVRVKSQIMRVGNLTTNEYRHRCLCISCAFAHFLAAYC